MKKSIKIIWNLLTEIVNVLFFVKWISHILFEWIILLPWKKYLKQILKDFLSIRYESFKVAPISFVSCLKPVYLESGLEWTLFKDCAWEERTEIVTAGSTRDSSWRSLYRVKPPLRAFWTENGINERRKNMRLRSRSRMTSCLKKIEFSLLILKIY